MSRMYAVMLGGILCCVILLPLLSPYDPQAIDYSAALQPPSPQHVLGTDALGRDVVSRFLHGGQRTLTVTLFSLCIALVLGIPLGVASGYFGGWVDSVILMVLNTMLALPGLLFALIIVTLLGQSPIAGGFAIGLAQIAPVGQMTRTAVRSIRSEAYVTASIASGASNHHLLLRTIAPNILPTVTAYGSVTFVYCLLNVAGFGYLGLIGQPELPEWGRMLNEGREVYREAIWVSLAPGLALTLLVMTANTLADRLTTDRSPTLSANLRG